MYARACRAQDLRGPGASLATFVLVALPLPLDCRICLWPDLCLALQRELEKKHRSRKILHFPVAYANISWRAVCNQQPEEDKARASLATDWLERSVGFFGPWAVSVVALDDALADFAFGFTFALAAAAARRLAISDFDRFAWAPPSS